MAFDLQPTLKGSLIELRPLTREDFEELFAAASDPLIWEQHPENDRYKREVFQKYFDGAIESKGAFAIIERASGRIIGSSRFCDLNLAESEVEIGWTFLERAFWGGAYNRELKSLMLDHAFQFVDRVVFDPAYRWAIQPESFDEIFKNVELSVVGEKNLRSQKALEKIGARFLRTKQVPTADSAGPAHLVFALTRKPE